jgi:hypothetical protein
MPKVNAKLMDQWVGSAQHPARVKLSRIGMEPEVKAKAVNDLASRTPVKVIGGQRHFLLHRMINDAEAPNINDGVFDNTEAKVKIGLRKFPSVTSWTSNPYQIPQYVKRQTVSAWIPESYLSFFPSHYAHVSPALAKLMNNENEVIVKPGRFTVAHHSVKDQYENPGDVSLLHYMDRHASEIAQKEGLPFKPGKYKENPFS